jgi:hypothetical protein
MIVMRETPNVEQAQVHPGDRSSGRRGLCSNELLVTDLTLIVRDNEDKKVAAVRLNPTPRIENGGRSAAVCAGLKVPALRLRQTLLYMPHLQ